MLTTLCNVVFALLVMPVEKAMCLRKTTSPGLFANHLVLLWGGRANTDAPFLVAFDQV